MKILCIRFSAFGDVLLAVDSVQYILQQGTQSEIHFLTKECYKNLVQLIAPQLIIHTIPDHANLKQLLKTIHQLRKENFSLILDLHNNLRSRTVSMFLSRVVQRVNKRRVIEWSLYSGRKLTRKIFAKPYWRIQDVWKLITPSRTQKIISIPQIHHKVFTKPGFENPLKGDLHKKYICMSMESAWRTKRWPKESFIKLAQELLLQNYHIVWLGLETQDVVISHSNSYDMRGKLEYDQLAAVLQNALLLVCNDTGLMHLSEILGTPVVAVFGPTTKELGFAPRLPLSQTVEVDLWCRPCSKTGRLCHRFSQPQKCLSDISHDIVINTVLSFCKRDCVL